MPSRSQCPASQSGPSRSTTTQLRLFRTSAFRSRHVPIPDGSVSRAAAQPTTTPGDWHLTDRGIAVIMVIAAMILTAALVVIGLTVVRVTSTDYDAGLQEPGQAQR